MSKIENILNKTSRGNKEAKKKIVVIGLIIGILFSVSILACVFYITDIDSYIKNNTAIKIYEVYDKDEKSDGNVIFFFGDSGIGYSTYPPFITEKLRENGYNISAYNLYQGNEMPVMRAIQMQNVIDAKPVLVVYGLSYRMVSDFENWVPERVFLVHDKLKIRSDSMFLYTADEMECFNKTMNVFDLKMFLESAIKSKYFKNPNRPGTTWHDDGTYYNLGAYRDRMQYNEDEIREAATNPRTQFRPEITNKTTRNQEALTYIVDVLRENDIPVLLVSTPLNPILSNEISVSSRENFHNYLNSTETPWIDLEQCLGSEYFVDIYHVNEDGMFFVSNAITEEIITEVENNVIHYA